jgi:hypothetical protein
MKTFALTLIALAATAGAAVASDIVTLTMTKDVDASADATWKKVGGYCQIDHWMTDATCSYKSGTGGLGTVRAVAVKGQGGEELMVGQSPHSYTYTMLGQFLPLYHGTLGVESAGKGKAKIVYTLLWDQEPLPADQREKTKDMMHQNFTAALDNMKKVAEAK